MPNPRGRAGLRGTPARTLAAFLDHYTYESDGAAALPGEIIHQYTGREKRINGRRISPATQRSIRRWRNGQVDQVSVKGLAKILALYGFDLAWFHKWAKDHDLPVT